MSVEQILQDCRRIKEAGTSSKVPVNITILEELARDAAAWRSTPECIREAARAVRGK
jgi:hypothetical protein